MSTYPGTPSPASAESCYHRGTPKKKPRELLPVGRKRKVDADVTRKLEEAFAVDGTVAEACAYAGISDTTYYEERQREPTFADKMDRAQQFCFVLAKKTVLQAMTDNDGNLAMKWLKNRQRDRYHEKVEQDVKQTTVEEVIAHVEAGAEYAARFDVPVAEKRAGS
jgi:hypothetical protein